jgi:hypothetical protein
MNALRLLTAALASLALLLASFACGGGPSYEVTDETEASLAGTRLKLMAVKVEKDISGAQMKEILRREATGDILGITFCKKPAPVCSLGATGPDGTGGMDAFGTIASTEEGVRFANSQALLLDLKGTGEPTLLDVDDMPGGGS